MFLILLIVILLVGWALHLMQQAMDQREFSLMLAGFLVSVAAAALVSVYFLMGNFMGYMNQIATQAELHAEYYEYADFFFPAELVIEDSADNRIEMADSTRSLSTMN